MRNLPKLNIPILIVSICFCAACSPSRDKAVAEVATEEFHNRFNNSAFGDIYDRAEPDVKEMQARNDFLGSMEAMRKGQGAVVQAKELAVDYNYSTDGNMIKLLYEVTYEKGIAKEEFIWIIADGKGILHSYRFLGPPASR
jgi:hypothetical protein